MSYDFKPTYHIGMTPEGYYIGTPRKKAPAAKPAKTGIQLISTHDLRQRCFAGDQEAIQEWTRRNENCDF